MFQAVSSVRYRANPSLTTSLSPRPLASARSHRLWQTFDVLDSPTRVNCWSATARSPVRGLLAHSAPILPLPFTWGCQPHFRRD